MPNLVLSRRVGESIVIDGPCVVTLMRIRPNTVRLAIEADPSVRIMRSEIEGRDQGATDGQNSSERSGESADADSADSPAGPAGAGD